MVICKNKTFQELCLDDSYIRKIEEYHPVQILFAALKGSQVWGYSNAVSNYNFYLFFQSNFPGLTYFRIQDKKNDYSMRLYDLKFVMESNRSYLNKIKKFPSILYRDPHADEIIQNQSFENREDGKLTFLFETLYSPYIWDSGYLKDNLNNLLDDLSILGLLDYYYSRAYGSYHNLFLQNEKLKGTKYLDTFLGIACMNWLFEKRSIPDMNINSMIDFCCPDEIRPFLMGIIEQQKNIGLEILKQYEGIPGIQKGDRERKKVMVMKNDAFLHWVDQELRQLAKKIGSVTPNEKFNLRNSIF